MLQNCWERSWKVGDREGIYAQISAKPVLGMSQKHKTKLLSRIPVLLLKTVFPSGKQSNCTRFFCVQNGSKNYELEVNLCGIMGSCDEQHAAVGRCGVCDDHPIHVIPLKNNRPFRPPQPSANGNGSPETFHETF